MDVFHIQHTLHLSHKHTSSVTSPVTLIPSYILPPTKRSSLVPSLHHSYFSYLRLPPSHFLLQCILLTPQYLHHTFADNSIIPSPYLPHTFLTLTSFPHTLLPLTFLLHPSLPHSYLPHTSPFLFPSTFLPYISISPSSFPLTLLPPILRLPHGSSAPHASHLSLMRYAGRIYALLVEIFQ